MYFLCTFFFSKDEKKKVHRKKEKREKRKKKEREKEKKENLYLFSLKTFFNRRKFYAGIVMTNRAPPV